MKGLIEALDAMCLLERSELRDDKGRLVGIMLARPNGDIVLRDKSHLYMGAFNARRNETRDRRGKLVGKGNVLAMLIKEGAAGSGLGSDSSNSGGGGARRLARGPNYRPSAGAGPARGGSTPPAGNPNPNSRANTASSGRGMLETWFERFVAEL